MKKKVKKTKKLDIKGLIFGKSDYGGEQNTNEIGTRATVPITDINNGVIITRDNRYIKALEVLPVNFYLKSPIEQQNIIYYYSSYLKIAPSNLQILVTTRKANIDDYCENMEHFYNTEKNENCKEMILENAELINYLASSEAVTRRFFIAFEYEDKSGGKATFDDISQKLSEDAETTVKYLDYCSLECVRHDYYDDFLLNLLYSVLNKRSEKHITLKNVGDMLTPVHGVDECEELVIGTDGQVSKLDVISPTDADFTKKNYVVVDGMYHAYLYIAGYGYKTQTELAWLSPLVEAGEGVGLNFILKKQRKDKILPQIAKTTMLNRSRAKDVGDTRMDYEELDSAIDAGLYMKDEINRNNEDFYYMHTLIEVTAENEADLEKRITSVETMCASQDMQVRRADYKHEQAFISSLPILHLDSDIERKAKRNVLTLGVAAAFPFSSFELCDQKGVLFGINLHNSSAVIMDLFDSDKYSNGSVSITGMSGAGKTFFLQLLMLRLRMQGVQSFIIAPLKGYEFRDACEAVGGKYIKLSSGSADCINIMEIRRDTVDTDFELQRETREDSVLADKIGKLYIFFSFIYPQITQEEQGFLDIAFIETYMRFGITHDNKSLRDRNGEFKKMPTLANLYEVLAEKKETKNLALALKRFVSGSASRFGGETNVDLDNKYIVLDISDLGKDLLPLGMFIALDFVWDEAKRSRIQKKAIALDELWELIGAGSNAMAAEYTLGNH